MNRESVAARGRLPAPSSELLRGNPGVLLLRQRHHREPPLPHQRRIGKETLRLDLRQRPRRLRLLHKFNPHLRVLFVARVHRHHLRQPHCPLLIPGVINHQHLSTLHARQIPHRHRIRHAIPHCLAIALQVVHRIGSRLSLQKVRHRSSLPRVLPACRSAQAEPSRRLPPPLPPRAPSPSLQPRPKSLRTTACSAVGVRADAPTPSSHPPRAHLPRPSPARCAPSASSHPDYPDSAAGSPPASSAASATQIRTRRDGSAPDVPPATASPSGNPESTQSSPRSFQSRS